MLYVVYRLRMTIGDPYKEYMADTLGNWTTDIDKAYKFDQNSANYEVKVLRKDNWISNKEII